MSMISGCILFGDGVDGVEAAKGSEMTGLQVGMDG
jgi:beta-phosphoglucomutase-like phosphatase (HAD superfamily)